MRFLTKETFKAPPTAEVQALMPAEIAKVNELTEQGLLAAVYTAADLTSVWMVWKVDSQAALEETHNTLPLHLYMNNEITVLGHVPSSGVRVRHPIDVV